MTSLLDSAKGFLIEAIDNHSEQKTQFAILHAVTAMELVLKERLWRVNKALIYKAIDTPLSPSAQTVALRSIPQRLANVGMPLTDEEVKLIEGFADWRNQIVHHLPDFDPQVATHRLPRLLDTLAEFLRRDLDAPIESFLPRKLFGVVHGLLGDWNRVVDGARNAALLEGSVLTEQCPGCGASHVLCLRDDRRVHCHLCQVRYYRYERCDQCGRQTVGFFSDLEAGIFCSDCMEEAGDRYMQSLDDIRRDR